MARSDTTTSPTPFSPFSTYSAPSEATSDELPDLGAFTNVFRALNDFQHYPRTGIPIPIAERQTSISSLVALSPTSVESVTPDDTNSTVWSPTNGVSYFSDSWHERLSIRSSGLRSRSLPLSERGSDESDTEGEELLPHAGDIRTFSINEAVNILRREASQPSLGYLGEALGFIAAERARFVALRDTNGPKAGPGGSRSSTSENIWRHVVQPRRKRRRKKTVKSHSQEPMQRQPLVIDIDSRTSTAELGAKGDDGAVGHSSSSSVENSSPSPVYNSTSVTSGNKGKHRRSSLPRTRSRLLHSRSTPTLRLAPFSTPLDPRVLKLRALAHKLRLLFPQDAARLASILRHDFPDEENFVDPRGPSPRSNDTLVHVFIDHSNILIGFLTYLRRHPTSLVGKASKRLSHAALALILERGRSITRRVLVTSSPLYQPMETAEQLGYEVRIYARVPDMGDGMDRQPLAGVASSGDSSRGGSGSSDNKHRKNNSLTSTSKGHTRNRSSGATSESDPGTGSGFGVSSNGLSTASFNGNNSLSVTTTAPRIKYREQGVDELLQLKLHQAIADVDTPPLDATIVLATGDGNVGQFNEEGFLGCVRTALKKGWRVELYAWEGGLSRSWKREFLDGPYKDKFTIIGLSKFGPDLLEV